MFVPSPYRSTNGTSYWNNFGKGADGIGPSKAIALASIGTPINYASYTGIRVRKNMQRGILSSGLYTNTPYENMSVRYSAKEGVSFYYSTHWIVGANRYCAVRVTPWNRSIGGIGIGGAGFPHDRYVLDVTNLSNVFHNNLWNRNIAELRVKLRDNRFDSSESLAGMKASYQMVAERTSQVLRTFQAVRRGRYREALRILGVSRPSNWRPRTAASAWLELQYGWLPLLSDIKSGVDVVNNGLINPEGIATVTRRSRMTLPDFGHPLATRNDVKTLTHSQKATSEVESKLVYRLADPGLHYLTQLSLENPVYLAWVSLPFSFVVDWIAPVATWLQALTAPLGLTFVSGYSTRRVHVTERMTWAAKTARTWYKYESGSNGEFGYDMVQIKRTKYASWPLFYPYLTSPFTSNRRLVSAIALLMTSIRS